VRQPIYEMGKEAGRILLLRLEGGTGPERLHKVFPTQLVVRESTI
jgi:DNA-binding LacI/PurR family transcriptional regulator